MKIDRSAATPIYMQVADYLRNEIYAEKWEQGDQIPSEFEMMKGFDISRGTVKKAIDVLVKEGLLEQVQGKGTFVTGGNISYPLGEGLLSFAETLEAQDISYNTIVLKKELRKANKRIAELLEIDIGSDYLYMQRIRSSEGEKIMLIENRLNHNLVPGILEEDFNNKSLFRIIEKNTGKNISHSKSRYAARVVGNERGRLLEVNSDSPVLHLEQLVYLDENIPIELGNVWLIANKYYLGTIFQRKRSVK